MRGGGSETLPGKGSCRVSESLGHFDAGKEHSNASLRRFVGLDSCPASAIVRNALAFGPQQRRDDAAAERLFLLPRAFLSPRSLLMDASSIHAARGRPFACGAAVSRSPLLCLCENEVQPLERNKRGGGAACEREREKRRSTESRCGRGSSLYFCLALWRWARMP